MPNRMNVYFKLFAAGLLGLGLVGCAEVQSRYDRVDAGSSLTDLLYQRTLASIAKIRYYHGAKMLPDDFEISKATVALNDTISATAGTTLGGTHGIIIPNIGVTPARAEQSSVDMVPTNDPVLLSNQAFILSVVSRDQETYRNGSPASGCLYAEYDNHNQGGSWTVWVDNNPTDMNKLTYLVRALMGDTNVPVGATDEPVAGLLAFIALRRSRSA